VRTRVKICGVRTPRDALAAVEAGADAIGLVFHPASPRAIDPTDAWAILGALPPFVSSVGLFVDATVDEFCEVEEVCPTDYSQLHGGEDVEVVRQCGPRVIKAVRFDPATIRDQLALWDDVEEVDAILVDGSAGGQGTTFDWTALAEVVGGAGGTGSRTVKKPLILAGGLTPENVGAAIRSVRPFGVDVSSGVERERGVKDPALIRAFCAAVRQADAG
jgi:phosphoribosylanthranilate isomerase